MTYQNKDSLAKIIEFEVLEQRENGLLTRAASKTEFCNAYGFAHGDFTYTVGHLAAVASAELCLGRKTVVTDASCEYLTSLNGPYALAETELLRAGNSRMEYRVSIMDEKMLPLILKRVSFETLDDMYAAIGYGGITATRTVNRIKDVIQAQKLASAAEKSPASKDKEFVDKINEQAEKRAAQPDHRKAINGILVEGLDNCLIKFSKCCTPVPGDEIIGFITRGAGISVHRKDCSNYLKQLESGSF